MEELQMLSKLSGRTVYDVAVEQCRGTDVDPSRLAALIANDPDWLTPAAVQRWAQLINERGYPDES